MSRFVLLGLNVAIVHATNQISGLLSPDGSTEPPHQHPGVPQGKWKLANRRVPQHHHSRDTKARLVPGITISRRQRYKEVTHPILEFIARTNHASMKVGTRPSGVADFRPATGELAVGVSQAA
jgi:hypothetical protein